MSASENVTEAEPSSATARIAWLTASAQRGVGVPSPIVHKGRPVSPAAVAAAMIWLRARSVSAEQLSKRAPSPSTTKRSVKGVMTGRGAEMSSTSRTPDGAMARNSPSSRRFSASLSEMAVTSIRSAVTEILDRSSRSSASSPKASAAPQVSGAG